MISKQIINVLAVDVSLSFDGHCHREAIQNLAIFTHLHCFKKVQILN